jgi:Flp pilus assembly protein TadG
MIRSGKTMSRGKLRGMVLVLAALLLVAMLSFVALAVDIGVIATAQAQLKTVTDAAALAGARQLASDRRISTTITNLTPETNAARTQAIAIGQANSVLGQAAQVISSNVVIGYKNVNPPNMDPPDANVNTSASFTTYNSVQVTASTTVAALFSAAFRSTGSTVSVTSTATVEVDQIQGFQDNLNVNAGILPIVMDSTAYNQMITGNGGDNYTFTFTSYNPPNSNGVTAGPDGIAESVTYPITTDLPGNWGTINFGVSSNSTKSLGDQIANGITPAQMTNEFPSGTVTAPHQFGGNPGISAGLESALTSIIGQAVTVPIYDQSGGNGTNAWYHVVSFASVRVVAVKLTGNNKYVVVQPAINDDPTAIPNTGQPNSWSSGGVIFLHLSR